MKRILSFLMILVTVVTFSQENPTPLPYGIVIDSTDWDKGKDTKITVNATEENESIVEIGSLRYQSDVTEKTGYVSVKHLSDNSGQSTLTGSNLFFGDTILYNSEGQDITKYGQSSFKIVQSGGDINSYLQGGPGGVEGAFTNGEMSELFYTGTGEIGITRRETFASPQYGVKMKTIPLEENTSLSFFKQQDGESISGVDLTWSGDPQGIVYKQTLQDKNGTVALLSDITGEFGDYYTQEQVDSINLLNWNRDRLNIKDVTTTPYNANTLFNGTTGSTTQSTVGSNMPYQSRWLIKAFYLDTNNSVQIAYDISTNANVNTSVYIRKYRSGTWGSWNKLWTDSDFSQTNVTNWNSAYSWGNHATAGYTTQTWVEENFIPETSPAGGIESTDITNWNLAFTNQHTHGNKEELDQITETSILNWENAYAHSINTNNPHSTSILKLTDTPSSYLGHGRKFLSVNSGATAMEFRGLLGLDVGLASSSKVPQWNGTAWTTGLDFGTTVTNNSLLQRTANGRAKFSPPTESDDGVTLGYFNKAVAGSLPYIPLAGNTTSTRVTGDIYFKYDSNVTLDARENKIYFNQTTGSVDFESNNGVRVFGPSPNAISLSITDGIYSGLYLPPTTPMHYVQKQYVDQLGWTNGRKVFTFTSPATFLSSGSQIISSKLTPVPSSTDFNNMRDFEITWKDSGIAYKITSIMTVTGVQVSYGSGNTSLTVEGSVTIPTGATLLYYN